MLIHYMLMRNRVHIIKLKSIQVLSSHIKSFHISVSLFISCLIAACVLHICFAGMYDYIIVLQLGWTALMEASSRGYNDALCILLHKGADFNIKNIVRISTVWLSDAHWHMRVRDILRSVSIRNCIDSQDYSSTAIHCTLRQPSLHLAVPSLPPCCTVFPAFLLYVHI